MDYEQFLADKEAELRRELSEVQKLRQSLHRIQEMAGSAPVAVSATKVAKKATEDGPERTLSLKDTLHEMALACDQPFTAPELYEGLKGTPHEEAHKASVSAAVKELERDGKIEMLEPSAGSRAAVYANETVFRQESLRALQQASEELEDMDIR